jgi:serine/threonine protein kinase
MSSTRSVLPALPPPSYPPVAMVYASRLTAAAVVIPDDVTGSVVSSRDKSEMSVLGRRSSVEGNVLCIDNAQYFWLHRKIRTTATKGSIRIGFCLKAPALHTSRGQPDDIWEVMVTPPDEYNFSGDGKTDSRLQLVAIRIEKSIDLIDSTELAALNYVAVNSSNANENIQSTLLLASDSSNIYVVMPYEDATSMTLLDYCLEQPGSILAEDKARKYIQQILRVSICLHFL